MDKLNQQTNMKDLTPQQEAEKLFNHFDWEYPISFKDAKQAAKFTAQQIADNTTGQLKYFIKR